MKSFKKINLKSKCGCEFYWCNTINEVTNLLFFKCKKHEWNDGIKKSFTTSRWKTLLGVRMKCAKPEGKEK